VASARGRGHGAEYVDELLAAYGDADAESLEPFLAAHALYDVVWRAYARAR
jgi:hypothetical protein